MERRDPERANNHQPESERNSSRDPQCLSKLPTRSTVPYTKFQILFHRVESFASFSPGQWNSECHEYVRRQLKFHHIARSFKGWIQRWVRLRRPIVSFSLFNSFCNLVEFRVSLKAVARKYNHLWTRFVVISLGETEQRHRVYTCSVRENKLQPLILRLHGGNCGGGLYVVILDPRWIGVKAALSG